MPRPCGTGVVLALVGLLTVLPAGPAVGQDTGRTSAIWPNSLTGLSLTDALLVLRDQGLKIVFTSSVVRPSMTVQVAPGGSGLRQILAELLTPHELDIAPGPGESLVVVPASKERAAKQPSIAGFVLSRGDLTPVGPVAIRLIELDKTVLSASDGSFVIGDLAAGIYSLEVRQRGFVVERVEAISVATEAPVQVSILLDRAPITEDRLAVTPSRVSLLRHAPVAPLALSRDDLLSLPHLGGDFFRALGLLPGIAANDVSAEFHVRGARPDETKILIDGQELFETYHLKDFDSALSVVAPTTLESVDLSTGGFSAQHGDRMSGVLDMTTVTPIGAVTTRLGLSLFTAQAGSSGTFAGQRGSWLAQARRGSNDFAGKVLGQEDPKFWDALGKVDYQISPRNGIRFNLLRADDKLDHTDVSTDGVKRFKTDYKSAYHWLTHQLLLGPKLFFDSAISSSSVDRDRLGFELDEDVEFDVRDRRGLDVQSVRQNWHLEAGSRHYLRWGLELRQFEIDYDYSSTYNFESPLAVIRTNSPEGNLSFQDRFGEDHNSFYFSDRFRPSEDWTLELGLRFDDHTQTDESHLAPRMNLAHAVGKSGVLRAAWGRFNQSQRPYELQVEDGDTVFHDVERSEHRVLGYERLFGGTDKQAIALRVEVYEKRVGKPRPRFENLYEPINEFQEVEPDRVQIVPDRSFSEGMEIFLRGPIGPKASWWVTYALSSTEDEIDGRRFRRSFDQTHSLNLDFDYRINPHWKLNAAWRFHTGWPTTPLSLAEVEVPVAPPEDGDEKEHVGDGGGPATEFVPLLGPRFSERLPSYHRLDVRASRHWKLGPGILTFFADVQNVYDRANVAGFDFDIDEEAGTIIPNAEEWTGFLPSAGLSFEF